MRAGFHQLGDGAAVARAFDHEIGDQRDRFGIIQLHAAFEPLSRHHRGHGDQQLVFFARRQVHGSASVKRLSCQTRGAARPRSRESSDRIVARRSSGEGEARRATRKPSKRADAGVACGARRAPRGTLSRRASGLGRDEQQASRARARRRRSPGGRACAAGAPSSRDVFGEDQLSAAANAPAVAKGAGAAWSRPWRGGRRRRFRRSCRRASAAMSTSSVRMKFASIEQDRFLRQPVETGAGFERERDLHARRAAPSRAVDLLRRLRGERDMRRPAPTSNVRRDISPPTMPPAVLTSTPSHGSPALGKRRRRPPVSYRRATRVRDPCAANRARISPTGAGERGAITPSARSVPRSGRELRSRGRVRDQRLRELVAALPHPSCSAGQLSPHSGRRDRARYTEIRWRTSVSTIEARSPAITTWPRSMTMKSSASSRAKSKYCSTSTIAMSPFVAQIGRWRGRCP